jgi:hypothetical protein
MVVPSCHLRDRVFTDRTDPVLFLPKAEQPSLPAKVLCEFDAKAFLKIEFPGRVIRVGLSFDLHMPLKA